MKSIILTLLIITSAYFQAFSQSLSAKEILEKAKAVVSELKSISYTSKYTNINQGSDDSVSHSLATIRVKRVPSDTIFRTHFHIKQDGFGYQSEYYYDGTNAIDIIHKHKMKEQEKTIVVIEPWLMGNGYNTVQSRMSVLPYFNELVDPKAIHKWLQLTDSMKVKEDPSQKFWILEWHENSPKDNYFATRRFFIDKKTFLPYEMHRVSTWNGVRMENHHVASDLKINEIDDESLSLTESYSDYKTRYQNRKKDTASASRSNQNVWAGVKAPDFNYQTFSGEPVSLKNRKSKLVLLDFWETWCGYCFLAMPKLKALHEQYNKKGLEIIGVVTENKNQVAKILQSQKFPYKTIYADKSMLENYKVVARPIYVLIDEKGKILEYAEGDLPKIEQAVGKYLGEK